MAVVTLTQENFEQEFANNKMMLIDFWASWCGPCQQFAPTFEAASEKHPDVVFAKVNTEQEQELAAMFQIRSIPTLMMAREQIFVFQQAGALPPQALQELIEKVKELDMDQVRKDVEAQAQQKA